MARPPEATTPPSRDAATGSCRRNLRRSCSDPAGSRSWIAIGKLSLTATPALPHQGLMDRHATLPGIGRIFDAIAALPADGRRDVALVIDPNRVPATAPPGRCIAGPATRATGSRFCDRQFLPAAAPSKICRAVRHRRLFPFKFKASGHRLSAPPGPRKIPA
jgi:hypothetical protein